MKLEILKLAIVLIALITSFLFYQKLQEVQQENEVLIARLKQVDQESVLIVVPREVYEKQIKTGTINLKVNGEGVK